MKKINMFLFNLFIIFLPLKVQALNGNVIINCDKTILEENTITNCRLTGNTDEEISGLSAILNVDGNITLTNIKTSSIWQGNGNEGMIDLYTDENKNGNFQIATFSIKAGSIGTGSINISNIKFSDANFITSDIANKNLLITIQKSQNQNIDLPNNNISQKKSNDATLKSIIINSEFIELKDNQFEYSCNVANNIEEIRINATPKNSKAQVTIPNNLELKEGINNFKIKVIAEDGTIKIYNINVNRLAKVLSNNSKLSEITIEGYSLDFDSDKLTYNLGDIKESKLSISTKTQDEKSEVQIFGNNNISQNDVIVIKVIAEDKTISEYIIYVSNLKNFNSDIIQDNIKYLNIYLIIIVLILCTVLIYTNKEKIFKRKK